MAEDGDASHPNPPPGSSDGSDFAPSTSKHNTNEDQTNLVPPDDDGERKKKELMLADEMMASGLKAKNKRDFSRAVVCYSRASQIRATHLGEHAIESAKAYHKYGRALLAKALQEADPTSSLAKKEREFREYFKESYCPSTTESTDASGSSQQGDGEGLFGADKDKSDLDLANEILGKARGIAQQYLEKARNTILGDEALEFYDIFSAFIEVALAREDFESSLLRYHDTLLIMGPVLEHDSTPIIKLNSRLCILASARPSDASHCGKMAITVSLSRMRLIKIIAEIREMTSPDSVNHEACTREIEQFAILVSKLEHKLQDIGKGNAVPGGNINPRTVSTSDTGGSTETPSTSGTSGTPETASTSGTDGSTETPSTSGTAGGTPETASPNGTGGSTETASTSGTSGSTETASTSDTGYAGGESDQGSEGRGVKRDPTGPPVDPSPTKKPAFDSP